MQSKILREVIHYFKKENGYLNDLITYFSLSTVESNEKERLKQALKAILKQEQ